MSIEIRLPNITGITEKEQLAQVKSYLYQLAQQLQWAMGYMGTSNNTPTKETKASDGSQIGLPSGVVAQSTFNAIKPLIIKSAEIVKAYYEQIDSLLKASGEYVAQSDFGEYRETNDLAVSATSTDILALFENTQTIKSSLDSIKLALSTEGDTTIIRSTDAWAKIGALETDDTDYYLYGMEIGQTNEINGKLVEMKFARYTSEGVFLYDGNSNLVAQIAQKKLIISEAKFQTSHKMGGFKTFRLADGSVARKWEGVDG